MIKQVNEVRINTEIVTDDFDSPWKEAVEHYFPEFMAFYFPDAYAEIDWSKGHDFLDQELRALSQDAELGKRYVDKLVKVTLLNGDEQWIYIHIEVQGTRQNEFGERMFVYNYRIFDHYRRPVASMAVLADEHPDWKPASYGFSVLGCRHTLEFPVAKLTDYHDSLDELLTADNPFALITAAHILTQRTRKNDQERYEAKRRLVRLLYQRHWDKQRVIDLFTVLDWLMRLPEGLEQQLWHEITDIEEQTKMRYVTTVERFEIEKRFQQGVEQGVEQGLVQGEYRLLKKQLEHRFGTLPAWVSDKLSSAGEQELERWGKAVLNEPTLDAVFNDSTPH